MKNTTDTPLLTKENNKQVKDKFTPLRYFITDVDMYQEEEMIEVQIKKKTINKPADQINKKNVK